MYVYSTVQNVMFGWKSICLFFDVSCYLTYFLLTYYSKMYHLKIIVKHLSCLHMYNLHNIYICLYFYIVYNSTLFWWLFIAFWCQLFLNNDSFLSNLYLLYILPLSFLVIIAKVIPSGWCSISLQQFIMHIYLH